MIPKTDIKLQITTASKLENLSYPLNRAFATVDTTLSAYKSLLERLNELDIKEKRLGGYLRRMKDPRNLNNSEIEFARAVSTLTPFI
jgi:hypothetical protein